MLFKGNKSAIDGFCLCWQEVESSAEKEKLELLKRLQEKKQQFEAYEIEKRRTSLALEDQDSDMADIDHETFPGNKKVFHSLKVIGFKIHRKRLSWKRIKYLFICWAVIFLK